MALPKDHDCPRIAGIAPNLGVSAHVVPVHLSCTIHCDEAIRLRRSCVIAVKHEASRLEDRLLRELARLPGAAMAARTRSARHLTRRTLKCPRCSRKFARPLHLGRRLSATHGRKRKKAA